MIFHGNLDRSSCGGCQAIDIYVFFFVVKAKQNGGREDKTTAKYRVGKDRGKVAKVTDASGK